LSTCVLFKNLREKYKIVGLPPSFSAYVELLGHYDWRIEIESVENRLLRKIFRSVKIRKCYV